MEAAQLNKKLDDNKKPLQYVTVAGIILAILAFFTLVYLVLHILFSLLVGIAGAFNTSHSSAAANTSLNNNANTTASSTETIGGLYKVEIVNASFVNAHY